VSFHGRRLHFAERRVIDQTRTRWVECGMPSRRAIAALVVIAAAWGSAASASQLAGVGTGSVVGVVSDAAGLPVPGVGITISGLD